LGCALFVTYLILSQSAYSEQFGGFYPYLCMVGIPLCVIQMIVCTVLIIGVHKEKPEFLKIWLVAAIVYLVLAALSLNCLGFALVWYFRNIVSAHRENLVEMKNTGPHQLENPGFEIHNYENKAVEKSIPVHQINEKV